MQNSINLDQSESFYNVEYNGKEYRCSRVTSIIESTHPTPSHLIKWIVNCGVEQLLKVNLDKVGDAAYDIAWNAHKEISKQALADGSEVHQAIDSGVGDKPISDAARACLRGYQDFIAEFIPVKITGELTVYDTSNLIAGTIDYLALSGRDKAKKKTLYIIDWKTSKAIYDSYKTQIAVYKWMLSNFIKAYLKSPNNYPEATRRIMDTIIQACGKKPKIKCIIVRFNKNPKARVTNWTCEITAKEDKALMAEFLLMLKLHNKRKEKENGNASGQ